MLFFFYLKSVPVAQWLEHCVSSAKVVGSISREHTCTDKKKMYKLNYTCKSLWIKASAKYIHVNVNLKILYIKFDVSFNNHI